MYYVDDTSVDRILSEVRASRYMGAECVKTTDVASIQKVIDAKEEGKSEVVEGVVNGGEQEVGKDKVVGNEEKEVVGNEEEKMVERRMKRRGRRRRIVKRKRLERRRR